MNGVNQSWDRSASDLSDTFVCRPSFVLQRTRPALLGLMDGVVATLAPIFAVAGLTEQAPTQGEFTAVGAASK
jgi:hypothetical protein